MLLVFRWLVHFNSEFLQVLILDSMVDARCDGSVPDASHCEWDAEKVGHRSRRAEPENRTENSQIQATENVRRWRPSASDGQRRATRFWSIAGTFFAVFICLVIFFCWVRSGNIVSFYRWWRHQLGQQNPESKLEFNSYSTTARILISSWMDLVENLIHWTNLEQLITSYRTLLLLLMIRLYLKIKTNFQLMISSNSQQTNISFYNREFNGENHFIAKLN